MRFSWSIKCFSAYNESHDFQVLKTPEKNVLKQANFPISSEMKWKKHLNVNIAMKKGNDWINKYNFAGVGF